MDASSGSVPRERAQGHRDYHQYAAHCKCPTQHPPFSMKYGVVIFYRRNAVDQYGRCNVK